MKTFTEWEIKFWNWMRNSGTIAWARLSVFLNALLAVLIVTDVSGLPFFKNHPEWLIYWNILNGVITELIRRRGTEVVTTEAYVPAVGKTVEVTKLIDTNAGPPPMPPKG